MADAHRIPLHDRHGNVKAEALTDPEDWAKVGKYRWYQANIGYVMAYPPGAGRGSPKVYLHRVLFDLEPGDKWEVDHINHDRLDNRRDNLRLCTRKLNAQNLPGHCWSGTEKGSQHRGVSWSKTAKKWHAYGYANKKRTTLGFFEDENEAAKAASDFRREHLPFAVEPELQEAV